MAACLATAGSACRTNSDQEEREYPYSIPLEIHVVRMKLDNATLATADSVVIDEVRGTTDHLVEGGSYIASGHYRLNSQDEAQLYVGLTDGRIEGDTTRFVSRGEGTFRIPFLILAMGKLHGTLYTLRTESSDVLTTAYYQEPTHAR
jgi:hypothetical protein